MGWKQRALRLCHHDNNVTNNCDLALLRCRTWLTRVRLKSVQFPIVLYCKVHTTRCQNMVSRTHTKQGATLFCIWSLLFTGICSYRTATRSNFACGRYPPQIYFNTIIQQLLINDSRADVVTCCQTGVEHIDYDDTC